MHLTSMRCSAESYYECTSREVWVIRVQEERVISQGSPLYCVITHCVRESHNSWDVYKRHCDLFLRLADVYQRR